MFFDFHVHSTASDGTLPPAAIARLAARNGLAAVALTDHDNCDGVAEFLSCPVEGALRRIPGIELSIDPGKGFDRFHLLGLGIDPQNETLKRFLRRILDGRNERNRRIITNFARIGINIPAGEIAGYANGQVLARPHFARWLAEHGHAPDMREAFAKYLLDDSPAETRCYAERFHPAQEEAFAAIHSAGGVCIMAHPKYWRSSWKHAFTSADREDAQRELARLKAIGLNGIEALYQANLPEENILWMTVARRAGLLMSGGSDFHGANKPGIPLGMTANEEFIAPLLERLVPGGARGGNR